MRRPSALERLYVDFDGFVASVEQNERPELRGRPVSVVPIASEYTSIIVASREARAQRIKADLARRIRACVTCSIGAAVNELLAKIAAEINKPGGLLLFPPEDLPGPLLKLALRDIPGIARGMEHRLARAGVFDMAQLWALAPKHARAIWGGVEGERFWVQLHGYAVERQRRNPCMAIAGFWRAIGAIANAPMLARGF